MTRDRHFPSTLASVALWTSRVVVALACELLTGCTLIGGAIGSSVPVYEPLGRGSAATAELRPGDHIEVARAGDPGTLEGIYRGIEGEALRMVTDAGPVAIDVKDIESVRVTRESYWLTGMLVGLGVDVAVMAIAGSQIGDRAPSTGAVGDLHAGSGGVVIGGH